MKKIYIGCMIFGALILQRSEMCAQMLKTAYFLDNSVQRQNYNPAFHTDKGFVSVPVLGGIGAQVETNSFLVDHFIYKRPDGSLTTFLDPSVNVNNFIGKLKDNNHLSQSLDMNIFGIGFAKESGYWTGGINLRQNANVAIPKGAFELAKLGPDSYSPIRKLEVNANAFLEIYAGYSRKLMDNLTVGGRLKYLGGLARSRMKITQFDVFSNEDKLYAKVNTSLETYVKGLHNNSTGLQEIDKYFDNYEMKGGYGLAGNGLALDLGAEYRPLSWLKVSASIQDIGFISWSKSSSVRAASDGIVDFVGFDIDVNDDSSVDDQIDDLGDRFKQMIKYENIAKKAHAKSLYMKMNIGAEAMILDDLLGFGLLYTNQMSEYFPLNDLTLSVNCRPLDWLQGALSTSVINGHFGSVGFALNIAPEKAVNITLGGDFIFKKLTKQFYPIHSYGYNLFAGIAIPLNI
ncbi:MAG: DUF5723 family protein [Bacteroidales bacterium]